MIAWTVVAPCAILVGPKTHQGIQSQASSVATQNHTHGLGAMFNRLASVVCIFAFLSCFSPTLDFFLFRQQVVGLTASQQSLVAVAGSGGWFLGASLYRHRFSKGRSIPEALKYCLLLWPCGSLLSMLVSVAASPGLAGFFLVVLEKFGAEFCKTMTFMPTSVLMQLHVPKGRESTAFTLMQLTGTFGQVLSRNIEFSLMSVFAVSPNKGPDGFHGFGWVAMVAAVWRIGTALLLRYFFLPRLDAEKSEWRRCVRYAWHDAKCC